MSLPLSTWYLRLLVFWGGLVTLGVELAASRLLAPYFGTSLMVWSCLIGLILVSLSAGYLVGGHLADRFPSLQALCLLTCLAALSVGLVPFVARPVLTFALKSFIDLRLGIYLATLAGVLLLLAVPMMLLGTVVPYAVRLATRDVSESGRVAGRLIAWSTLGSFVGALLPVMVLIPAWGTRLTFVFFSLSLALMAGVGAARASGARAVIPPLCVAALVLTGQSLSRAARIKPGEQVLAEKESAYQYLRVTENDGGWRRLEVNEGVVTHSKYHPKAVFTGGEWDYFAAAPFFNPAPFDPRSASRRWALLGLGGGTSCRIVTETYGPVHFDGVEPDPEVVRLGREFFGMTMTNLHVHVLDARAWLNIHTQRYDVIGVDAYRQPYVPFELCTVEFLETVRERLAPHGVVVMNVARTEDDLRLVEAMASTARRVFPSVFALHLFHGRNTVMVGSMQHCTILDYKRNIDPVQDPVLRLITQRVLGMLDFTLREGPVLTDDHAPVERMMDTLILKEALRQRRT